MRDTPSILPLTLANLTFAADGKLLLDDVSFTLPRGGITAMIGPNGAGKSLTLRLCHGLLTPTSGTVRWQHRPETAAGTLAHAMVFQRPVMLRRSVRANLLHALHAVHHRDADARADTTLDRFGLADLAHRPARLMSGGEQQRLAIARAWALAPEMLFLDEPTSHLDPGATRQIESLILSLADEGMTILLTTHDLSQARRLSQRTLLLHKGKLAEDAPTEAFFKSPQSAAGRSFVAGDLLW